MFEPTVIFQRTNTGRDEIYEKKRGLTQSERLVLIMVDGTTPYQRVRSKLPVLTEDRFNRALITLQKKELISEVFLPVEGENPEDVEQTVIDRFIQQDPTDPLTIISFDPEEDFGVFGPAITASVPPDVPSSSEQRYSTATGQNRAATAMSFASGVRQAPVHESSMDEALIQQAETLAEEMRARRPQYENPIDQVRDFSVPRRPQSDHKPAVPTKPQPVGLHWGYLLIGIGLAFIIGFAAARYTH